MKPIPQFDQLHVISDLHLGGRSGFQIFDSTAELVQLVDYLRSEAATERLALLINGDFVDFLAEAPAMHFDPAGAVGKLDRIVGDPAFAPVWGALQTFARTPTRNLIINLGNHDLELALPWVREHLLQVLAGDDAATRGRITLAGDGAGVLCQVGDAQVLCVHGNEVDSWNVADYETIRRIGRDVVQGRPVARWIPNAGAQLVIEVMNGLKSRYPFVDLLKPEVEAMVPTLLALDPNQWERVHVITATARRLLWDKVRMATGFLEGEQEFPKVRSGEEPTRSPVVLEGRLRETFMSSGDGATAAAYAESLLDRAEERLGRNEDPVRLIERDEQEAYLGLAGAAWKLVRAKPTSEVLREALEQLRQDRSFDFTHEDSTFTQLDALMGGGIDFLLAGHTHLERALPRKHGHGYYFNSGTWTRLIKLEESMLGDATQFERVFNAFKAGTMQALDQESGLVLRRPTVVSIWTDGPNVRGELRHVRLNSAGPVLDPVPDSQFIAS